MTALHIFALWAFIFGCIAFPPLLLAIPGFFAYRGVRGARRSAADRNRMRRLDRDFYTGDARRNLSGRHL